MMERLLTVLGCVGVLLCGCNESSQLPTSNPLCMLDSSREAAMEHVSEILEGMYFTIEKYDVDKGVIATKPLRGGQMFEPWRSENVGADNIQMANLHSILRTVTVNISEKSGQTCVDCKVRVRRLAAAGRPIDGYATLPSTFTASRSDMQKLRLRHEYEWVELADDEELAYAILQQVRNETEKLEG